MFLLQNFFGISNMPLVFFYNALNLKKSQVKNDVISFRYILGITFQMEH